MADPGISCECQQLLCSRLPSVLMASLDVKQGPWRSLAQSAVISFQHLPGGNGVPGTRESRGQRLVTCLGAVPVAAVGEGASVWSQEDKDEPVQSFQTGTGCSGARISQLPRSQGESRLLEPQVTPTLPPVHCYLILRKSSPG